MGTKNKKATTGYRKWMISSSFILMLLFAALLRGLRPEGEAGATGPTPAPATLPYAARGPHDVGARTLTPAGSRPLPMTIWYPADTNGRNAEKTAQAYQIKVAPPVGAIAIASSSGTAITDASFDLASGPYPLVILSPGFAIGGTSYAWLAEHLASHGLVIIAPEHREGFSLSMDQFWQATITRPQDILWLLAYVDEQAGAGGALEGLIDPQLAAVIGHSYGGYAALAAAGARLQPDSFQARCDAGHAVDEPHLWLCDMLLPHIDSMAQLAGLDSAPAGLWPGWGDPRVDAIVPLAGDAYLFDEAGLAEITVPVLAIGGTADTDTPYLWGTQPTYEFVSSPRKARIALQDAGHMIFTGTCTAVPWYAGPVTDEFCADAVWDREQAHELIKHFTTAFLLAELKQDAGATAVLAPEVVAFPGINYDAQGY